jgi:hypothetical protein
MAFYGVTKRYSVFQNTQSRFTTPCPLFGIRFRKYILANREGISVILILAALPTVFRHGGRPVNDSFTPLLFSISYHPDRCRREPRPHLKVNKDNGFAPVTNRYGASIHGTEIPSRISRLHISASTFRRLFLCLVPLRFAENLSQILPQSLQAQTHSLGITTRINIHLLPYLLEITVLFKSEAIIEVYRARNIFLNVFLQMKSTCKKTVKSAH